MTKIQLTNATAFEYTDKKEIIKALKNRVDESEHGWKDSRMAETIKHMKKLVLIEHACSQYKPSPMFLMHEKIWNDGYTYTKAFDYYSNCLCWHSFKRPEPFVQDAFIEYYNLKRDDERMEEMLSKIKKGTKLYRKTSGKVIEAEVIDTRLDCKELFWLNVTLEHNNKKWSIDCLQIGKGQSVLCSEGTYSLTKETIIDACKSDILLEIKECVKYIKYYRDKKNKLLKQLQQQINIE